MNIRKKQREGTPQQKTIFIILVYCLCRKLSQNKGNVSVDGMRIKFCKTKTKRRITENYCVIHR